MSTWGTSWGSSWGTSWGALGLTLVAATGAYVLSGQDARLVTDELNPEQGIYTLSGQAVSLKRGKKLTADQGSYILTGNDITPIRGYVLVGAQGAYALSGQDATFLIDYILAAAQGTYILTGNSADLDSVALYVNHAGVWKTPTNVYVKIAGVWTEVEMYQRNNAQWSQFV